jgi:hypothetical protein
MADDLEVNDLVFVSQESRQSEGVVCFLGTVSFAEGDDWVGIRLVGTFQGLGKNDGSVQSIRYFECPRNCGIFVKKSAVTKRTLTRLEGLRLRRELAQSLGSDRAALSPPRATAMKAVRVRSPGIPRLEELRLRRELAQSIQSKTCGGVVEEETLGTDRAALSPPRATAMPSVRVGSPGIPRLEELRLRRELAQSIQSKTCGGVVEEETLGTDRAALSPPRATAMTSDRVGSPVIPSQKIATSALKSPVPTVRGNNHILLRHDLDRVLPQVPKRPKPAQTRTTTTSPIVTPPLTPPSVVPKEMMNLRHRHGVSGGLRGGLPSGL